jgi:hypothetical protein
MKKIAGDLPSCSKIYRVTQLFLLTLLLGTVGCPSTTQPLNLIVFVEATPYPAVNNRILNQFLLPIYQGMATSERAMKVEIYAVSANTETETPLLKVELPADFRTEADRANLTEAFKQLKERYSRVYTPEASYLVDVLGTSVLLDNFVASTNGSAEAIYISDMIQQEAFDPLRPEVARYDFSSLGQARTLDQCREDLEKEFGSHLLHREKFGELRVQLIPLGLNNMIRDSAGGATEIRTVATAAQPEAIKTFWEKDFFRSFLRVRDVIPQSSVEGALGKIGL